MKSFNNHDLTGYNSYRIKAACSKAFFPENEEDFITIYRDWPSTPKIILGNGNNIILGRKWYDEYFIILNGCFDKAEVENNIISAEAGATMLQLSELALGNSLSGMEIFWDIPSSVGGAVVMNAGAGGEEIRDIIVKARYLDLEKMELKEIDRDGIGFEYRNSFFQRQKDKIVLKAWFRLSPGSAGSIKEKMESVKRDRWIKQPRDYPNCGSVFKRPAGMFVGPMIDELGLKGFTIGGAKVSEKHSGFIVNTGEASGSDILALIKEIKKRVLERFGIDLEVEQVII